jgi:hypothetical protein
MDTCYVIRPAGWSLWAACRPSRPAGLFSFGLLDGLSVRLATAFMNELPAAAYSAKVATSATKAGSCGAFGERE